MAEGAAGKGKVAGCGWMNGDKMGFCRMEEPLNTLVYKRTHRGDPDAARGIFGIHDCMGQVRSWGFDAVIGVGGKSPDRDHEDIDRRINWIGINRRPSSTKAPRHFRGPFVEFEHFVLLEENGPYLKEHARNLFRYMFQDQHVRAVMSRNLSDVMQKEVQGILRWANNQPSRKARAVGRKASTKRKC